MKWLVWRLKCLYVDIFWKHRIISPGVYVTEPGCGVDYGKWAANHRYEKGYMPHPGDAELVREWHK